MCGNNHWILCQAGQVNKIDPWPGRPKSYLWQLVIASPVIQQTDGRVAEVVSALLGLISVAYLWKLLDDWLLLYPPQADHLRFQHKHDCALYGRMWNYYTVAQCEAKMMCGNNHWILRKPVQ